MPRLVDHDARRAEIVRGVWLVIARDGLASVSMRTVAEAAAVSVGRIQHYFGGKEELLRASARAMIEAGTDHYQQDTEGARPADRLLEALGHPIRRAAGHGQGVSIWYAYLTAAATDAEIAAILAESKRGQESLVSALLGQLGTPARSSLPDARSLIAVADGLTQRVLIGDLSEQEALSVLAAHLPG